MERERSLQNRYSELQEKVRVLQEYEMQLQQQREIEMNQTVPQPQLELTASLPISEETYTVPEFSAEIN